MRINEIGELISLSVIEINSSILAWEIPWTESLAGYSPWGHEELDVTEGLTHTHNTLTQKIHNCTFYVVEVSSCLGIGDGL